MKCEIFFCFCASLSGSCCSGGSAALQFTAEEEGVAGLAQPDPETLEGEGGERVPLQGRGGLLPPVHRI